MKIYCPKCHTCYSIEVGLIPAEGKKLKCSRCGEVWLCTHADMTAVEGTSEQENDAVPQNVIANAEDELISTPAEDSENKEETEEAPETKVSDDEMNQIFSRLKDETEKIDTELESLPPAKKLFPKIKKLLGWRSRITISLEVLTLLIIIALSIFGNRYALVRKFPQLESVFSQIGIPSRIIGEGLEFQNVVRSYDSKESPRRLTIKGFIFNTTNNDLSLPPVLVNILDTNAEEMLQSKHLIEEKTIKAQAKIPFTLAVKVPLQAKYIMLRVTE